MFWLPLFVFDAIDNWLHHPQNKPYFRMLKENYEYINQNADIIFTVSNELTKMFKNRDNVKWISNGVDKGYFEKSTSHYNGNNITIGYVGKIQERIDFNLVEKCLEKYKNDNFLFLGPILSCNDNIKKLTAKYKNIKFSGDIHYNNLPDEMKKIDIAIIPHLVNDFTNSMSPLKLFEYLAAGKQVVTTPVAESSKFKDFVYVANNDEEFIDGIKLAKEKYKNIKGLDIDIKKSISDENTWENKADNIINEIVKYIK